jgi:hypothetical protein
MTHPGLRPVQVKMIQVGSYEFRPGCQYVKRRPERKCRVCGCTDAHGCANGCYWVEWDLCSACVEED